MAIEYLIQLAASDPDNYVIEMVYESSKGSFRRVVSPVRFETKDRFSALCLCRGDHRRFYLSKCSSVSLKPAHDYVIPVEMVEINQTDNTFSQEVSMKSNIKTSVTTFYPGFTVQDAVELCNAHNFRFVQFLHYREGGYVDVVFEHEEGDTSPYVKANQVKLDEGLHVFFNN